MVKAASAYLNEGRLDVENQSDPRHSHDLSSSISYLEDNQQENLERLYQQNQTGLYQELLQK